MAQWRDSVIAAGFEEPQTYVATGNMIVEGTGSAAEVTRQMDAIVQGLGLGASNKAIVRTPGQLQKVVRANPFVSAALERPAEMGVYCFAAARPNFDWVAGYAGPEHLHVAGKHLIVDYDGRISKSRLPALIEKRSGLATARNWNTVRALLERAVARQH